MLLDSRKEQTTLGLKNRVGYCNLDQNSLADEMRSLLRERGRERDIMSFGSAHFYYNLILEEIKRTFI